MSARENVTLGRPDASDEDIAAAIETAQAGFVYELPWGLDTRIGEQGMSLSGGQRQRLALARAVLAQPRILVLDDTLSALDVHTEALVEKALREVLRDGDRASSWRTARRRCMLADKVALLQRRHHHPRRQPPRAAGDRPRLRRPARRRRDDERVEQRRVGDVVMTTTDDWRGVAAENNDDLPDQTTLLLRERSRRLLGRLAAAAPARRSPGCWSSC